MHEAGETGTEGGRQIEGDVFGRCCCEWPRTDCRDVLDADARRSWLAALVAQPRSPGPLAPRATASFTFQPSGRHVVCAQPASEVEVRISRLDPLLQPLCNPREEQDGASIPGRDRARRGRDAPPGLRSEPHPVRRPRVARDVLHDREGALARERDRNGVGAHALARDTAGGVGGAQDSGVSAVEATIPARVAPRSRVCSSRHGSERPSCFSSAGRPPS
jgi:hypothetical protein